ncbi:MAG: M2 family metallopeptidase [Verrucomicrobiales bacterium]|nr:M2 family metallopeptidase [Verrucomicrobiales bacterium]
MRWYVVGWFLGLVALSVRGESALQARANQFLTLVNSAHQAMYRVESEAQWKAATDVKPEHDAAAETAGRARAAFAGNPAVIREARALLEERSKLTDLQVRQLERVLLNAAEGPMTRPDLVAERIAAETAQASVMNGFQFRLQGTNATANDLDRVLSVSMDLAERRAAWAASKASGPALKPGLVRLRELRNGVARELGHRDYFSLQMAAYGMTADEMLKLNVEFMRELRPLYLQLHTWVRHELAKRYGQPVPKLLPAHWINDRWSQEWDGIVEAASFDRFFEGRDKAWVTRAAEQFYTGIGFPSLPATFWTRSDLFPVEPGSTRKKNSHASCWHVDLENDIRSLMSVEPNTWWFQTAHHELGHAYYYVAYTRPEVPPLLRLGANPAFHEAVGELVGMASMQIPYLQSLGVAPSDFNPDPVLVLLNDALAYSVPFLFWSSGTMTHWEADVYARNLPVEEWNQRWWRYVREFQGVEPPEPRGEDWCDAATKTHINDAPCYYPNYSFATVLKFQFHDHIARRILRQPPQVCNYAGNREVGSWLRRMLEKGATEDWRKVLKEATGEDLSTRAMVDYYRPLMQWLEAQNQGRQIGWD